MVFFKIKVHACILIHPISYCIFLRNSLKISYLSYTTFSPYTPSNHLFWLYPNLFFLGAQFLFIFSYVSDSNKALIFSLPTHGWRPLTFKPTSLWSHPSHLFQQKNYLFSSTYTDPTLDPLPLVIIFIIFYINWLDKRGHYMWWYFSCEHGSLFLNPPYYMYILWKIDLQWNLLHVVSTIFASDLPVEWAHHDIVSCLIWMNLLVLKIFENVIITLSMTKMLRNCSLHFQHYIVNLNRVHHVQSIKDGRGIANDKTFCCLIIYC